LVLHRPAAGDGFIYAGQHYDDVHISIALANSGDLQLELIQQRCNTPTMYRDFLAAGNEGMQHWSSWPENYDEIYQRALATGYTTRATVRAGGSSISAMRVTLERYSRWQMRHPLGCASSMRSALRQLVGMAAIQSAASGQAEGRGAAEISKPAGRKQVKLRVDRVSGGAVKRQQLSTAADQPTI
jgi:hypothetical protein